MQKITTLTHNHLLLYLNDESLKKLQKKLEGVEYFIIDEKSMVGRRMLAQIDI